MKPAFVLLLMLGVLLASVADAQFLPLGLGKSGAAPAVNCALVSSINPPILSSKSPPLVCSL